MNSGWIKEELCDKENKSKMDQEFEKRKQKYFYPEHLTKNEVIPGQDILKYDMNMSPKESEEE